MDALPLHHSPGLASKLYWNILWKSKGANSMALYNLKMKIFNLLILL